MSTLYIDSTNITTDLCNIGGKHNTDKSPFAQNSVCCKHRKGYTAVYSMILAQYDSIPFNFAEIGIEQGSSLLMWSEKYPLANINAFEYYDEKIQVCNNLNLPNVKIYKTDVSDPKTLNESFAKSNTIFDIVIDDSSHVIEHENIIIENVHKYIKQGGILIIEDIERSTNIDQFNIDPSIWSFSTFIICHHDGRNCTDNDKILMLVKR
jgi:hypothetical protein